MHVLDRIPLTLGYEEIQRDFRGVNNEWAKRLEELAESLLMSPLKSLSGIHFPTEVPFFSCQLCPRETCPSRKAKYRETLAKEYGVV